jgi:hypothetical protein
MPPQIGAAFLFIPYLSKIQKETLRR